MQRSIHDKRVGCFARWAGSIMAWNAQESKTLRYPLEKSWRLDVIG